MKIAYLKNLEELTNKIAEKVKSQFAEKIDIPKDFVTSGSQTTTSNEDGGTNVYTFKSSTGGTSTFTVKNGSKGSKGDTGATGLKGEKGDAGATGPKGDKGDPGAAGAKGDKGDKGDTGATGPKGDKGDTGAAGAKGATGATGTRGSRWSSGTAITGTSTTATIFSGTGITDALINDYYLNTSTGYVYKCTVAGVASVAKWVYVGSIKGATGATGSSGATAAVATQTVNGLMSAADKKKLDNIAGGNDTSEITEENIDKIIAGTYSE